MHIAHPGRPRGLVTYLSKTLSLYLQSKEMNTIQAYTMVKHSISVLIKESRDFDKIVNKTNEFINWANNEFIKNNLDYEVENCLPEKSCSKKKLMCGEKIRDETPENPITRFKTQVFNVIYDQVVSSLSYRFESHGIVLFSILFLNDLPK